MKTPKRRHWRHWRRFDVFIVNFEYFSHHFSSVSIVNFEQVNAGWVFDFLFVKSSAMNIYFEKKLRSFTQKICGRVLDLQITISWLQIEK